MGTKKKMLYIQFCRDITFVTNLHTFKLLNFLASNCGCLQNDKYRVTDTKGKWPQIHTQIYFITSIYPPFKCEGSVFIVCLYFFSFFFVKTMLELLKVVDRSRRYLWWTKSRLLAEKGGGPRQKCSPPPDEGEDSANILQEYEKFHIYCSFQKKSAL